MKPSGSIAKLSIDFKASLADAQRAAVGKDSHGRDAEEALLRAREIIDLTLAELHRHGLQEPVGRLDTVAAMRIKLDAMVQWLAARKDRVIDPSQ